MPLPPYHVGPGFLVGLLFRKWLDLPVLVVASLSVDLEVVAYSLFKPLGGLPRYGHTLLFSAAIGLVTAVAMLPLKRITRATMSALGLSYQTTLPKMLLSGVSGAWLHVLIDGLYRTGAGLFWPSTLTNPLCRYSRAQVETICLILTLAALGLYLIVRRRR